MAHDTARQTAARALIRQQRESGYSGPVLDAALRRTSLEPAPRAQAAALFYGVLERQRTLDYHLAKASGKPLAALDAEVLVLLRLALYEILCMNTPPHAAVSEAVSLCAAVRKRSASGFVNGVLRGAIRAGFAIDIEDPVLRLAVEQSCSDGIARLLCGDYGFDRAERFLAAAFGRPPVYLRTNTVRMTTENLVRALVDEGLEPERHPAIPDCVRVARFRPDSAALARGDCFVQDAASQLCALALDPQPDDTVLDLCAAPGGKSFAAACLMENTGRVLSCDIHDHRLSRLRDMRDRLGLTIIETREHDSRARSDSLPQADRVLCDVPCSGLGSIRRRPEIRYKDPAAFAGLYETQRAILEAGASYVKPGGRLVYSTCTLSRGENDDRVAAFLQTHPDFALVAPDVPPLHGTAAPLTLWGPEFDSDGFFIAVMERTHG